jgi:hypothetical protein
MSRLDFQEEFVSHSIYYMSADTILGFANWVLVIYPAVASFYAGVFNAIRKYKMQADLASADDDDNNLDADPDMHIYDKSRLGENFTGRKPVRIIHFSECFNHFPTSARHSFPFKLGAALYGMRWAFSIFDYILVTVLLGHAEDTVVLLAKIVVWLPYLYFTLASMLMLCFYVEYPALTVVKNVRAAFFLVISHWKPVFWLVLLIPTMIIIGFLAFLVGLLITWPIVLIIVAYMYDHLIGVPKTRWRPRHRGNVDDDFDGL